MAENDIDNMKDVFLSGHKEQTFKMLDYLREELNVSEADYWNYIGYYVISVPHEKYEYALLEGKKFAFQNDFGIYWLNHYNERRSPIASSDLGYGLLPKIVPGGNDNRRLWSWCNEATPECILEYLEEMRKFLKVDEIFRDYNSSDDALTISSLSLDYEDQSKLFKDFIYEHGYGPFKEIHPLTFTGEYVKEPIYVKKK